MKKLLSAALVLTLGVTCTASFAACGGSEDEDTAKSAINIVKTLYDKTELYETPSDYTVLGQVKVGADLHTVNWSVSAEANNITDYIKIGTEMDDESMITVSVTKPEVAIEYKLTASVKVGKAEESYSFNRKVSARPPEAAGTKDDPYSVGRAKELASKMTPKVKLEESDNPVAVYVKGYIVDCGTDNPANNRVGYVWLVDEYSSDKDKNSPDAMMVLSINYDPVYLTGYSDLKKGNEIMVKGYLMNYQKNATSDPQPEVTYYKENGVTCEYIQKVEKTPEEKVDLALSNVDATFTVSKAGETELPASSLADVTFAWALKEGTAATVADGKITVATLPAADATVVVTVTASNGSVSKSKDVTVTIKAAVVIGENELLLTSESLNLPSAYANAGNATIGEIAFSWIGMADYGDGIQMRTSDKTGTSSFFNTVALSSNITKVVFDWSTTKNLPTKQNVLKVEFASNADFTDAHEEIITFTDSKNLELNVTGAYTYVRITHNNNGAVYLASVKIVCAE